MTDLLDPNLKRYAQGRQAEFIDAVNLHGSMRAAAKALGLSPDMIGRSMRGLQRRAAVAPKALDGFEPSAVTAQYGPDGMVRSQSIKWKPDPVMQQGGQDAGDARDGTGGYIVKGVSTYYDAAGEQRAQWVKTTRHQHAWQEAVEKRIEKMSADRPALAPMPGPAQTADDLLNLYVFTDYHMGMRAWAEEGGDHWDLPTAKQLLISCFANMIERSPDAAVGFIAQLGDFIHFDSLLPMTPTSGHVVDSDAQYEQIIDAVIDVLQALVDMALTKHERVVILAAEGNHDITGSMWMRGILRVMYRDEPRVEVIRSASPYYAYQWGENMLAFHHGHLKKLEALSQVFAAGFAKMWGATRKRYAHAGHNHHEIVVKEMSGMKIIQHPTLAPRDSHSSRHAYFSERQTSVTTYHKRYGKDLERIFTPEMLEAA